MVAYRSIALLNPWELVKVNLLRKRIFKDIIKNLEMTYPGLSRWAINPMTKVLIRERKGDLTERGEVMWSWRQRLESCSHKPRILKPPDTARVKEGYSPEPSEGLWPCWHLDLTSGPQSHKRQRPGVAELAKLSYLVMNFKLFLLTDLPLFLKDSFVLNLVAVIFFFVNLSG